MEVYASSLDELFVHQMMKMENIMRLNTFDVIWWYLESDGTKPRIMTHKQAIV